MPARFAAAITLFVLFAPAAPFAKAAPPLWKEGGAPRPLVAAPSWSRLVEAVGPAVVHISVRGSGGTPGDAEPMRRFYEQYFGQEAPPDEESIGSGFLISPDGYVLTNDHVIEGGNEIVVALPDERRFTARVVGADSETDVALLALDGADHLPIVALGDSDRLAVGDAVAAIGNPFNLGQTVTTGIVSAKGRGAEAIGEGSGGSGGSGGGRIYDFIQTDTAINFGNSGGPLIDASGDVVGMNTAIYTGGSAGGSGTTYAQGIGFAIPINMLKQIVPLLASEGTIARGYLGVLPQSVTPALAKALGLPRAEGALVSLVRSDSPAARAGLAAGDCVLAVDGEPVKNAHDFRFTVALRGVDRPIALTYLRAGVERHATATLTAPPGAHPAPARRPIAKSAPHDPRSLGLTVTEVTPELATEYDLGGTDGVVVETVDPASGSLAAGVEPNDVILQVGNAPIKGLDDYDAAVRKLRVGDMVLLLVQPPSGLRHFLAFELR